MPTITRTLNPINLEIIRGNDARIYIPVTRDGSALNITGASFALYAKRWRNDTTNIIESTDFEFIDAAAGTAYINISREATQDLTDTVELNYVIEMIESDGRLTTVAFGKLRVIDAI